MKCAIHYALNAQILTHVYNAMIQLMLFTKINVFIHVQLTFIKIFLPTIKLLNAKNVTIPVNNALILNLLHAQIVKMAWNTIIICNFVFLNVLNNTNIIIYHSKNVFRA